MPDPMGGSLDYNTGELTPQDPNTPTPAYLWFYTNHDPRFYVAAMAANGFIREAWRADKMPAQIKPFIPPRPIPAYIGVQSSVGQFVTVVAPEF